MASGLFRRGVLVAGTLLNAKTIRIEPALNIPRALVDEVLDTLLEAIDGEEAVALLQRDDRSIDLLITDVIMPRMGGIEATRLITTEMPEVKVIALSMQCNEGYRETLRQAGASCFVSKDSAFEELIRAIEGVITNTSE